MRSFLTQNEQNFAMSQDLEEYLLLNFNKILHSKVTNF